MPRLPLHNASGTGIANSKNLVIRFVRYGCANRPFFHVVVMNPKLEQRRPPIEQLGSYDPMENKYNERLCALNIERILHWISNGASISKPVSVLLGLAGILPIHPASYIYSWRKRRELNEASSVSQT